MRIDAYVQWAILAASLANVILLLWLGLTVLLSSARRGWGTWLTGGALCSGALFFLFQAVVVSLGFDRVTPGVMARWPLVWCAGFAQPLAWYLVMLWFGGYWAQPRAARHHRWHRLFLTAQTSALVLVIIDLIFEQVSPFRAYAPTAILAGPMFHGIPMVAIVYVLMVGACTAMALDILAFPAPASQLMLDQARRRARGWLVGNSLVLLVASLLLGGVLLVAPAATLDLSPRLMPPGTWRMLVWSDLIVTLLIGVGILLLGQAIVVYEAFAGGALPRRGLRHQWRNIVVVAAVFASVMAVAQVRGTPAIFSVLLTVVMLAVSYALHNWRAGVEREGFMARLRTVVAGPRLTDALQPGDVDEATAAQPLAALCHDLLGARWACLAASGPLAALAPPVIYGEGAIPALPAALLARCTDPDALCLPVEPGACGPAAWAVPLWGARGRIGVLLLGEKTSGDLYTQEEMALARAAGERLLDALAGARMARHLLHAQRARLAGDQQADRRTRRAIHDDILPQLHTAMLALSADPAHAGIVAQLADAHHALAALLRELPTTATLDLAHHGLVGAVRAHLERAHPEAFARVRWHVDPAAEARARALSPLHAEVVHGAACEAIRNAARYASGGGAQPVTLTITLADTVPLALTIVDDGVGLAAAQPCVGAGQGHALHGAMMAVIGGSWCHDSTLGAGTRVTLTIADET